MIYDGECGFCRTWIARWHRLTGDRVEYAPYQQVASRFPAIPREAFAAAVHLVEPDGQVYKGAEAVFRSLARRPGLGWLPGLYRCLPPLAMASEAAYRWVARNRGWLGRRALRRAG
jgi:predicted DCC family thiol-disulfide oxidoreductase YuxK